MGNLAALESAGPHPQLRDGLMLFGQFVGAWDIDATYFDAEGDVVSRVRAEWHFGWALGGRAVIDVLFSPPAAEQSDDQTPLEYGTTVRVYDPDAGDWKVTWNPAIKRRPVQLTARPDGDGILLEGVAADGELQRWSFSEITDDSFLWQGRVSADGGATWVFNEEMRATRRVAQRSASSAAARPMTSAEARFDV